MVPRTAHLVAAQALGGAAVYAAGVGVAYEYARPVPALHTVCSFELSRLDGQDTTPLSTHLPPVRVPATRSEKSLSPASRSTTHHNRQTQTHTRARKHEGTRALLAAFIPPSLPFSLSRTHIHTTHDDARPPL